MPVIDNQKMACEPCIRGHRSTKCNHANERMMIPVRKPGRPLSICPHPPNNRCSCTSVTAALPRTRRCGGCVSKNGASSISGPTSGPKAVPRSPTKRSFSGKQPLQLPNSQQPMGQGQFIISALERPDMGLPPNPPPTWPNGSAPPAFGGMHMPGQQQQQHQHQQQDGGYMLSMQSSEYLPSQPGMQAMIPMAGGQFQHEFQLPGQANGSQMYVNGNGQFQPQFPGYSNGMDMAPFGPALDGFTTGPPTGQINGGYRGVQPFPVQAAPPQEARGSCCGSTPTPASQSFAAPAAAADSSSCCAPPPPPPPPSKMSESSCCGPRITDTAAATATRGTSSIESAQITPASSRNSLASNGGTASCSDSPTSLSSSFSQHAMLKTESMAGGPIPLSSIPPAPQTAASAPPQLSQDQVYANIVASQRSQQHGTPAWYRYAPHFGTASTPLQQSQWRSSLIVMDGASIANASDAGMLDVYGAGDAPGSASTNPAYTVTAMPTDADGSVNGNGNSHLCSCGDDCNCVGCVAHPYNAATQNAVQAAWEAIDDSSSSTSSGGRTAKAGTQHSGSGSGSGSHRQHTSTAAATAAAATGVTTFHLANGSSESSSPVQEFTPSDSADDQPLSADDFLFVNYSVAPCIGEDSFCPCGDDCQCFGCTLHNPPTSV